MKTSLQALLLLAALCLTACNPFSFDPPDTNAKCQRFVSTTGVSGVFIHDREVGYRLPRFLAGSSEEIAFVKTGVSTHQILRLQLGSQQEEVLLESNQPIQDFDLGPNGEIAFVAAGEVKVRLTPTGTIQSVPFLDGNRRVLWMDNSLLVLTKEWNVAKIDLNGQVLATVSPPYIAGEAFRDYANWAKKDSILLFGRHKINQGETMLYRYSSLDFQLLDSLDISAYGNLWENSGTLSRNYLDLTYVSPDLAFLSRKSRLYRVNLNTKVVSPIWERTNCQVLESGISLSANGKRLVLGAVQILDDPHQTGDGNGYAEFGILLLDINGENEEVLFP
jgi:hypothetical protein